MRLTYPPGTDATSSASAGGSTGIASAVNLTSKLSKVVLDMSEEGICQYMAKLQQKAISQSMNDGRVPQLDTRVSYLSQAELELPLVGREASLHAIASYFKSQEENRKSGSVKQFPMLACAWNPGVGKTALLHRFDEVETTIPTDNRIRLLVSYYNGMSCKWIDHAFAIEASFAWRLLYVAFLKGGSISYASFCNENHLPSNADSLTLMSAVKAIGLSFRKVGDIGLFIGIDEFQSIGMGLDGSHVSPAYDSDVRSKDILSALCTLLYESRTVVSSTNEVHIYALFAGTDWGLIQTSGQSSGLIVQRIPVPPLTPRDVEKIMEPANLSCPLAHRHLFLLSGIPRLVLGYRNSLLKYGHGPYDSEMLEKAFEDALNLDQRIWGEASKSLMCRLVALCFTCRNVKDAEIEYLNTNGDSKKQHVKKLADCGFGTVMDISNTRSVFAINYNNLQRFARREDINSSNSSDEEVALLKSTKWLLDKVDDNLFNMEQWQLAELFACGFMACRINALLVLGVKKVSLKTLWAGSCCNSDFMVTLKAMIPLMSAEPFRKEMTMSVKGKDDNMDYNWTEGRVVLNSSNGAGVDMFFSLPIADTTEPKRVVCAVQVKVKSSPSISCNELTEMLKKIEAQSPTDSSGCLAGSVLVSVYWDSYERTATNNVNLRPNSVVILKHHIREFFGMFSSHPAAVPYVEVNTCTQERLKTLKLSTVRGLGGMETVIKMITDKRKEQTFSSETEFFDWLDSVGITIDVDNKQYVVVYQ